jgi:carbamate kinase
MSSAQGKLIVLAIGGNSLIKDPAHKTVRDQYEAVLETCQSIAELCRQGHRVIVTHGNGPQVGFILRRSELSAHELHIVPLDSCGADTQGAIGYQLQMGMYNVTRDWPERIRVATVVTQVLVDTNDPAFAAPSKPIGSFMDEATATQRQTNDGWHVVEDAGRGFRRVVASPRPIEILELDAIKRLVDDDFVVVAVGGGGIPVVKGVDGTLRGSEAVIDKDLASSLLARELNADLLFISTAVEKAYLDYGKPDQRPIDRMTAAEARQYLKAGHFKPGSMKPKIQAMLEFIEAGGREALLADPPNLLRAVAGETGTRLVP